MSIQSAKRKQPNPMSRDAEFAARYGLTIRQLHSSKIIHRDQPDVSCVLGFEAPAAGYDIPYFDTDGRLSGFHRVRLDAYELPFNAGRPLRYLQAKKSGIHIYFSPLIYPSWSEIEADSTIPLIITEGELKAACACAHGLPTIGIGGVSMWRRKLQGELLHKDIARFAKNRLVSIVFDSDATTNPEVLAQENKLAAALLDAGSRVKVVRLG